MPLYLRKQRDGRQKLVPGKRYQILLSEARSVCPLDHKTRDLPRMLNLQGYLTACCSFWKIIKVLRVSYQTPGGLGLSTSSLGEHLCSMINDLGFLLISAHKQRETPFRSKSLYERKCSPWILQCTIIAAYCWLLCQPSNTDISLYSRENWRKLLAQDLNIEQEAVIHRLALQGLHSCY